MTWCSKIYDIFNGWNEEHELPSTESSKIKRINSNFYAHEIEDNNDTTVIQHDSPFLERSDSLTNAHFMNEQLYNNDYLNSRDYPGEHICADTLFSCHQRDEQYYYNNPDHRPYELQQFQTCHSISRSMFFSLPPTGVFSSFFFFSLSLSFTYSSYSYSFNIIMNINFKIYSLFRYIGNTENNYQQQLSRSYSLELPMELKRNNFTLPSNDNITPRIRYSLNQPTNRPRANTDKSNRLSLDHGALNNNPVSLRNRQESLGYRISTRSSNSDYESSELQSRYNEQLEREVQHHIHEMLTSSPNGVFPMIYRLPSDEMLHCHDHYRIEGGYGEPSKWIFKTKILPTDCRLISDNVASIYTNYFYDQYHYNLYSIDADFDPVVMSVKPHDDKLIVIVRTKEGSKCMDFIENGTNLTDYVHLSKQLCPNLHIDHFDNCTNFKAQQFVKAFDDKLETHKFKFGIIYQRRGQTTEEEFFNNERHNRTFDEFLDIIATRISLKNFKGYRGGLDVSEQTDSPVSYYECYEEKEIMFHVSTLLPFTHNDSTQIQRKRHIGNDIVAVIFQEENTPFHPTMIKSNFLHVFLVVQPVQILSRTCYKIMLVARDDIEEFPPFLQPNVVYVRTAEQLKPFILSKLINAEYAAYRCRTFSLLQERTRCSYLKTLCENLSEKSYENLCDDQKRISHGRLSLLSNSTRKRYLSSMKKMFTRSNSTQDRPRQSVKSDQGKIRASKKLLRLGKSMDSAEDHRRSSPEHDLTRENNLMNRHINGRSDESLNSNGDITSGTIQSYPSLPPAQVHYCDESDEGLDSMSSADTARAPYDSDDQDVYRQQLREKALPSQIWHVVSNQRHISIPQTPGIHMSEEATV